VVKARIGREAAVVLGAILALGAVTVACSEVAKLDLAYTADGGADAGEDARQKVRPSNVEPADSAISVPLPTDLGGCDGGLGESAGCDDTAGLGCCLTASGSQCIEQREAPLRCTSAVFLACRQSSSDSQCCWRTSGDARFTAYAATCDDGAIACLDAAGCPAGESCQTRDCVLGGTIFTFGACGSTAPKCPGER
jgi:hypothetical protein